MAILIIIAMIAGLVILKGTQFFNGLSAEHEKLGAIEAAKIQALYQVDAFEPALVYQGLAGNYGLGVDPATKQFAIAVPNHQPRLYHYSQLVAVEVDKDGHAVTSTTGKIDTSNAAMATALIGPLGLALGAKTSSESLTKDHITRLSLKLYLTDVHSPFVEIPFNVGPLGASDDPATRKAVNAMEEWYGRLRSVVATNDREPAGSDASRVIMHDGPIGPPMQLSWKARTFAP